MEKKNQIKDAFINFTVNNLLNEACHHHTEMDMFHMVSASIQCFKRNCKEPHSPKGKYLVTGLGFFFPHAQTHQVFFLILNFV